MAKAADAGQAGEVKHLATEFDGETRDLLALIDGAEVGISLIKEETGMSRQRATVDSTNSKRSTSWSRS